MKFTKLVLDMLIIALTVLALLITTEIALRIIFMDSGGTASASAEQSDLGYSFHSDYLVSLKPDITKKYVRRKVNGGDVIYWKTNSDGFRGNELKKDPGTRIIIYGDSNIQARFSKLENTLPYRLETYLRENGKEDVEVINAGVVGFGPDQSLIRFEREADIYRPDIVIFNVLAGNDFGDLIKNRLFELDNEGSLVEAGHKKTIDKALSNRTGFNKLLYSTYIFKAVRKLKKLPDEGLTPEGTIQRFFLAGEKEYSIYKLKKPRIASHFGDHYDLDVAVYPDSETARTKVDLMEAVLKKAKRIADEKMIRFLVIIQPSIVDLTTNYIFSYEHLRKYPGYKQTNLTAAVEKICVSNNIEFINLFDRFISNDPSGLFFKGNNNHWNDRGQDIAAKEVMLYLTRKKDSF